MSAAFCQCLLHSVNVCCTLSMSAALCQGLLHSVNVYCIMSISTAFCIKQCLCIIVGIYRIVCVSYTYIASLPESPCIVFNATLLLFLALSKIVGVCTAPSSVYVYWIIGVFFLLNCQRLQYAITDDVFCVTVSVCITTVIIYLGTALLSVSLNHWVY